MMTPWKAKLSRTDHKWHRVEVEGAPVFVEETDVALKLALEALQSAFPVDLGKLATPVALVRQRDHAVSIAALPTVYENLLDVERLLSEEKVDRQKVEDLVRQSIAKLEGR